jgi:hypothetical protein
MLVSGVLFVLFDVVAMAFVVSVAIMVVIPRRSRRARGWAASPRSSRSRPWPADAYGYQDPERAAAEASFARHPASRSRATPIRGYLVPKGPDDDPEFLRALEQRIRQMRGDGTN